MYHVDRHVVKMILEISQLLCTALWLAPDFDPENPPPYKKTHENHPSAIWTRASKANWKWLKKLGLALCEEYTYRYGKVHKTEEVLRKIKCPNLPNKEFTFPPQAMPDEYKHKNSIVAYRNYYILGKAHLHLKKKGHCWKNRNPPPFILEIFPEYKDM